MSPQASSDSLAAGWLRSQLHPLVRGRNGSTLTPDRDYPAEYTGVLEGLFRPGSPAPAIVYATPVQVARPSPIPPRFEGTLSGTVQGVDTRSGALRVDAYLVTDAHYPQGGSPLSADGAWAFEAVGRAGEWRFQLVDGATGQPVGAEWRQEINGQGAFHNLVIQAYAVTDTAYLQGTVPASTSGRWSVPVTGPGAKLVRLVDALSGEEYVRWTAGTGLIRSYAFSPGHAGYGTPLESRCYVYDQAVGLLALLGGGDTATAARMGAALAAVQHPGGAFPFAVDQLAPAGADPYFRSGASAWAAYALLRLAEARSGTAEAGVAAAAGGRCLDYLLSLQSPGLGLVRGGSGRYLPDGSFDAAYPIPWYSTEHNVDAWFALRAGGRVLGRADFGAAADRVRDGLLAYAWNAGEGHFWQEVDARGLPDGKGALDVHSWGAILLRAWGMDGRAAGALARADALYRVADATGLVGYRPYTPAEGYPGAAATVWFEGSFGVALARLRVGVEAGALMAELEGRQLADGAFRYATLPDPAYEITDLPSVASTGWYLLARPGTLLWTERDVDATGAGTG